jgi:hypothetical protein
MIVWGVVGPRGSQVFSCDEIPDWEWARCHKAGCSNFVCHQLSDQFCWVHLDSLPNGQEFITRLGKIKEPVE